jgi:hypothetical protein
MQNFLQTLNEMCSFIQEVTSRAPTRLITRGSRLGSLYYDKITTGGMTTLAILPPAGCVTIRPTKAVSDPVAGRQVGDPPPRASPAPCSPARDRSMASRGGGNATQRHSLSTCHPNGAPVAVKEDTAAVAKLLFVRLISSIDMYNNDVGKRFMK